MKDRGLLTTLANQDQRIARLVETIKAERETVRRLKQLLDQQKERMDMSDEKVELWCIVELLGHVRLAGRLTEEERFGSKMGRLDIPTEEGFVTQWFGGGSVYRITAVTEQVARDAAKRSSPAPVNQWDYPRRVAAAPVEDNDPSDEVDW